MSVIYTQGGATTIADATTTVSGKVRLATIAEAGGSSEAIAVTPAGLQAEISGLASGLIYRGTINVADFGATLANASLGDYYKIATGGTAGDGRVYATGDAIIVNADMGGVFADAKLDKIDNVDPSTSDEITGARNATAYTGANTDSVTTHLDGIDSALALRAPLASPALTGTPSATTASAGDSSLRIATTAFVSGEISAISLASTDLSDSADLARLASPALSGTPTAPTASAGTNTTQLATTEFVTSAVSAGAGASALDDLSDVTITNAQSGEVLRHNGTNFVDAQLASTDLSDTAQLARLASPALTGTPTAPTASAGTNTTQLATTAFVSGEISAISLASTDLSDSADLARLASPALTGTPTAPTASAGTNTTQLATTEFVTSAVAGVGGGFSSLVVQNTANVVAVDANTFVTLAGTNTLYPWKISVPANPSDGDSLILNIASNANSEPANSRTSVEIYASDGTTLLEELNANLDRCPVFVVYESASTSWLISPTVEGADLKAGSAYTLSDHLFGYEPIVIYRNGSTNPAFALVIPSASDVLEGKTQEIILRGRRDLAITSGAQDIIDFTSEADIETYVSSITLRADAGAVKLRRVTAGGAPRWWVQAPLANLDDLAPLDSPALTGTPTAPTASAGTNTTQLATTAFVTSAVAGAGGGASELNDLSDVTITNAQSGEVLRHNGTNFVDAQLASTDLSDTAQLARLASPALTGTPTAPTASAGTNTTQLATTAFVSGEISAISLASTDLTDSADLARLASPALTGTPTAPTASAGTNTTQLATTAFVTSAVSGAGASELNDLSDVTISTAGSGEVLRHNGTNFVNADLASTDLSDTAQLARLASPALTGTPTAPTASAGNNSTQLATTAYVDTAVSSGSGSAHDPSLVLVSSASYDMSSLLSGGGLTATQIKGLNIWYSGTSSTFTVTLPDIATVGAGITSIGGNPADTFEIYVGRGSAGDIVLSSTEGIDATGDGSVSFTPTSFTLNGRQFLKVIAWRSTSNNAQYIVESADLSEIVEDTTPQLGGDLDTNQQQIITLSNRNIELAPNGTGVVELRGNQSGGNNTGALLFQCEQNSHGVTLKAPLHSASASLALTLPASDGGAGDALITDGSGNLSFSTISGGGGGFTYSAVSSATTAQAQYYYSVTGTTTITLPASSGVTAGQEIRIKNMGSNTVTVARTGTTDTIDGQQSITMAVQYQALSFVSNGSNGWEII